MDRNANDKVEAQRARLADAASAMADATTALEELRDAQRKPLLTHAAALSKEAFVGSKVDVEAVRQMRGQRAPSASTKTTVCAACTLLFADGVPKKGPRLVKWDEAKLLLGNKTDLQ